jgi:hypothetical protein
MGTATVAPGSSTLDRARTLAGCCLAFFLLTVGIPPAYCENSKGRGGEELSAECAAQIPPDGATGADRPVAVGGPAGQSAAHTPKGRPSPIVESGLASTDRGGKHWMSGSLRFAGRPDGAPNASLSVAPRVYGRLSERTLRNIRLGFPLALKMVSSTSACSALFEPFHAAAVETLASTWYAAPTGREKTRICVGRVAAFTAVGGRVTKLCPEFGDLYPREAALTLVHEALHSAGMPESPATPGALTSQEINALVARACGSARTSLTTAQQSASAP